MDVVLFVVSLAVTLYAAAIFASRLDRLGKHLGLPDGIVGLLTAAGADAPELATAVVALVRGAHEASFGVVVGASVFNIATMLGLSALLAGAIVVPRRAAAVEGGVSFAVIAAVLLYATSVIPAWALVLACAAVVVPYLVALARGPRHPRAEVPHELTRTLLEIPPAVAVIVLGSIGMVHSALSIAHRAGLSDVLAGTLLLAVLASLPNAYTGIRLGRRGRGEALLSETTNSNTINLVGGVAVPALVVSYGFSGLEIADVVWLLAATGVATVLMSWNGGAGRRVGALFVGSWVAFAGVQGVFG